MIYRYISKPTVFATACYNEITMISRQLINSALSNKNKFESVFESTLNFTCAAKAHPECAKDLLSYLFRHQEQFNRLITNRPKLIFLAQELPKFSESIINFVIQHPDQFSRLVKEKIDLKKLAEQFKNHAAIFSKPTILDAMEAAKSYTENMILVRSVAAYLFIAKNTEQAPFNCLPPEILIIIAAHCADNNIVDYEKAYRTASRHYRPKVN